MICLILQLFWTCLPHDIYVKPVPGQFPSGQMPPDNFPQDNCPWTIAPPDNCYLEQSLPGQLSPRRIPSDNSHLGLLYHPPDIYTQTITAQSNDNYKYFHITGRLFFVSFPSPNYIISAFCYDNKNKNDNTYKTWSLKLLSVIIL